MEKFIDKAWKRCLTGKKESNSSHFLYVMFMGEMLCKVFTSTIVSCVPDDDDDTRYSAEYYLVRATGLGKWIYYLREVLEGPTRHKIDEGSRILFDELSSSFLEDDWRYKALQSLHSCFTLSDTHIKPLQRKETFITWFNMFRKLRNETRAHGAMSSEIQGKIALNLASSIKMIQLNSILLKIEYVHVEQYLSGLYKVDVFGGKTNNIQAFLENQDNVLDEGVHFYLGRIIKNNLAVYLNSSDDCFFPNGNFYHPKYQILSYCTGESLYADTEPYMSPPGKRPSSETEGKGKLELLGKTFTNIPEYEGIYINRDELEDELSKILLLKDRHPVITLLGRGGIGKTCLALSVLNKVCEVGRFDAIIWFSARDVDLVDGGPKDRKPSILNENDIATQFSSLLEPIGYDRKDFVQRDFFEKELNEVGFGSTLFVFDNFETIRNPIQVYKWIDTHIRNPNKVLITSRLRDFKGDYPISVGGMNKDECLLLIETITQNLKIESLLTKIYIDELIKESGGHPYVIKILLGQVAMSNSVGPIRRILASREDILKALFERTYSSLSRGAKRVFLTLANWKTVLPTIAVESVIMRQGNEVWDVEKTIEELNRYSFIEIVKSPDQSLFILVPLVAYQFGQSKLSVSELKTKIDLDTVILRYFGASNDVSHGVKPRILRFFESAAKEIQKENTTLEDVLPIMEFIGRRHSFAYELLSDLCEQLGDLKKSSEYLKNYLELEIPNKEKVNGWTKLVHIYKITKNHIGVFHALTEICLLPKIDLKIVGQNFGGLLEKSGDTRVIDRIPKEEMKARLNLVTSEIFKRIKVKKGVNTQLCYDLALLFKEIGKRQKAKDSLKIALEINSNHYKSLEFLERMN